MTKTELVGKLAAKTELSKKDAAKALEAFMESVKESLVKGEKVQLIGFGTFEVRKRAARRGRSPLNGKHIRIRAHKAPAFRAGKYLKDAVN
ncbi:MAG: HU family DNA-binding protein [Selenomonadaceae bacterium]|nr:HU family DNA-binding protein [Selenomonadaceae bacterium]